MQLDLDRPQPSREINGRQKTKWSPKTKLSITQSIFKLKAPNFAWQFILTLRKNGRQKTKWSPKKQNGRKKKNGRKKLNQS